MKSKEDTLLCAGLNKSASIIHQNNKEKGFWDRSRNIGEMLMLVTSELSEALDAHQKGNFANLPLFEVNKNSLGHNHSFKLYIKDTFEDEIADAVIRLLDLAAGLDIDLETHIQAKVEFNTSRERLHGKQY